PPRSSTRTTTRSSLSESQRCAKYMLILFVPRSFQVVDAPDPSSATLIRWLSRDPRRLWRIGGHLIVAICHDFPSGPRLPTLAAGLSVAMTPGRCAGTVQHPS